MSTMAMTCDDVMDELDGLVDGDATAIARHGRAPRRAATRAAMRATMRASAAMVVRGAGADYVAPSDLMARLEAKIAGGDGGDGGDGDGDGGDDDDDDSDPVPLPLPLPSKSTTTTTSPTRTTSKRRMLIGAAVGSALAAAVIGGYALTRRRSDGGGRGRATRSARSRRSRERRRAAAVSTLKAGGELARRRANCRRARACATDERTRARSSSTDGTRDRRSTTAATLAFDTTSRGTCALDGGRIVADVAHVDGRPASFTTPSGAIDVVGTRFVVDRRPTALTARAGRARRRSCCATAVTTRRRARRRRRRDRPRRAVASAAAPAARARGRVVRARSRAKADDGTRRHRLAARVQAGRDARPRLEPRAREARRQGPHRRADRAHRDHRDVPQRQRRAARGRLSVPAAAPTRRSTALALDVKDARRLRRRRVRRQGARREDLAGRDRQGGAARRSQPMPQEIIWVPGRWRDPALLDWKRGGRFELRDLPDPGEGLAHDQARVHAGRHAARPVAPVRLSAAALERRLDGRRPDVGRRRGARRAARLGARGRLRARRRIRRARTSTR